MGKIAYVLHSLGYFVRRVSLLIHKLAERIEKRNEVVEEQSESVEEVQDLFPYYSFATFKEGMASKDYCTRHDAAAKLVGWYLHQDGHPLIEELVRAAEVLLEDTLATSLEVSYLTGAWKDQASATNEKDKEDAEEQENKIYMNLQLKEIKNQGDNK